METASRFSVTMSSDVPLNVLRVAISPEDAVAVTVPVVSAASWLITVTLDVPVISAAKSDARVIVGVPAVAADLRVDIAVASPEIEFTAVAVTAEPEARSTIFKSAALVAPGTSLTVMLIVSLPVVVKPVRLDALSVIEAVIWPVVRVL